MRACGRRYRTDEAARHSKRGLQPDAVVRACRYGCGGWHVEFPAAPRTPIKPRSEKAPRKPRGHHARIKPVSDKRRAENRQRRKMADRLYPERPKCAVPGCPNLADDLHEPKSRARGGSIVSEGNQVPLCRYPHHDDLTFRPESELAWAYEIGLLVHSWDSPDGAA